MRDNPINALRETLRCGFAFRKSRLESLCVLVFGVFVARTVNLSHLACHFPGRARSSSNYRRLQRFFEQVDFDYDRLAEFLVAMMGLQAGPWRLTMDRTNWRLGRRDVNILMIGIVNRAIAIPVCWRVLDKAGNSNTKERIAILEHVLRLFGVDKIASLLADREFIGDAWLAWLQEKAIPFHIRIRSNIKIANTRGRMVKARELFRDLKPGESRILSNARRLSEARKPKARPVFVAALHLKTGELLIVVTNDAPEEALAIYAQRWQIETLFAALKTRGFNLEDTHMTDPERISKLTAVLSITFCWAHKVGAPRGRADPPQNPQKDGKIHLPRFGMVAGKGHPLSHPHPIQHQDRQHAWSHRRGSRRGRLFRHFPMAAGGCSTTTSNPGKAASSPTPGASRRPENPRPGPSSSPRSISRPANC